MSDGSDGRVAIEARDRASPGLRARPHLGLRLTIVLSVVYFAFVFAVAFAPNLMADPLFGAVSIGIALGIVVILIAVALTGFYVWRANASSGVGARGEPA